MRHRIATIGIALGIVLALAAPATAVPSHGVQIRLPRNAPQLSGTPTDDGISPAATKPPLKYHDGPVVLANISHTLYWIPPGYKVKAGYQDTVDGYFADVAADSGTTDNVYDTLTQYFQTVGGPTAYITYDQVFAGAVIDSKPFPTHGNCPPNKFTNICLTTAQLKKEINRIAGQQAWPGGPVDTITLLLPDNVRTCFSTTGGCNSFCAYHTRTDATDTAHVFSVIPYPRSDSFKYYCGTQTEGIFGNDADFTLDSISHEHREMINDPLWHWSNGWYGGWWDKNGWEGSDKCSFRYGSALGTLPNGAPYNQVINGQEYYLQGEWSNAQMRCVWSGV